MIVFSQTASLPNLLGRATCARDRERTAERSDLTHNTFSAIWLLLPKRPNAFVCTRELCFYCRALQAGSQSQVLTRDVQIIAFSIFGPCCDDVIASALALQVGELWRQNLNLMRESTHFEGRRVNPGSEANF